MYTTNYLLVNGWYTKLIGCDIAWDIVIKGLSGMRRNSASVLARNVVVLKHQQLQVRVSNSDNCNQL
jgi:hypothetical protein